MILCNLNKLIFEKKTTISAVSQATGISRTTLTSLYTNRSQGIQLDTANALCKYFNVDMGKLFLFTKYEIYTRSGFPYFELDEHTRPSAYDGQIVLQVELNNQKSEYFLSCQCYLHYNETNQINFIEALVEFYSEELNANDTDLRNENDALRHIFNELQPEFKKEVRENIYCRITSEFGVFLAEGYELSIDYPEELK